jgi:hypothetical protein
MYRCSRLDCRKEWSCLHETFFANSKLPLHKSLFLAYHWLARSSHATICAIGSFSPGSVTKYFKYLRQLIADSLNEEDFLIGGPGIRVQLDECKLGKRKFNRGHRVEGTWVFGGVEITEQRKVFLKIVEKRDRETLHNIILRHVLPGSIVITDFWKGYLGIEEHGYTHLRVNHSETFVNPENGACTNNIEGTWYALKNLIPIRNRTKRCGDNLWEFIWRRKHEKDLWSGFLSCLREVIYK